MKTAILEKAKLALSEAQSAVNAALNADAPALTCQCWICGALISTEEMDGNGGICNSCAWEKAVAEISPLVFDERS